MNIKLVRNIEEGIYSPINEQLFLQTVDGDYHLDSYNGKKVYILNQVTNERFEILPHIKKYTMADISYGTLEHDYCVFTSAERVGEDRVKITFYMYYITDGSSRIIKMMEVPLAELAENMDIKVFMLDENFCIFETVRYNDQGDRKDVLITRGLGEHELMLHSIDNDEDMLLTDSTIAVSGIDKVIPMHGNVCAIKIGCSLLEEKMYDDISFDNKFEEIIGIINVKQFISDIRLNQDNIYIDELDRGNENTTIPYMMKYGNEIVYSKVDVNKKLEEVVIYDYENKIKKVRLNSNITRVSDLTHTYVLNDMPCIIKNSEDVTEVINLNTQKQELELGNDVKIKFIIGDLIVTEKHAGKKLFSRKENCYIEVFKYPDMELPIFSTKAKCESCIEYKDNLFIFTN